MHFIYISLHHVFMKLINYEKRSFLSKAFNKLPTSQKIAFVNSFVYNEKGELLAFYLDQEENNISDNGYSKLISLVLKTTYFSIVDSSNDPSLAKIRLSGNPPHPGQLGIGNPPPHI